MAARAALALAAALPLLVLLLAAAPQPAAAQYPSCAPYNLTDTNALADNGRACVLTEDFRLRKPNIPHRMVYTARGGSQVLSLVFWWRSCLGNFFSSTADDRDGAPLALPRALLSPRPPARPPLPTHPARHTTTPHAHWPRGGVAGGREGAARRGTQRAGTHTPV